MLSLLGVNLHFYCIVLQLAFVMYMPFSFSQEKRANCGESCARESTKLAESAREPVHRSSSKFTCFKRLHGTAVAK